jgi:hypothetical protein
MLLKRAIFSATVMIPACLDQLAGSLGQLWIYGEL